jgi:hypothetical protein
MKSLGGRAGGEVFDDHLPVFRWHMAVALRRIQQMPALGLRRDATRIVASTVVKGETLARYRGGTAIEIPVPSPLPDESQAPLAAIRAFRVWWERM